LRLDGERKRSACCRGELHVLAALTHHRHSHVVRFQVRESFEDGGAYLLLEASPFRFTRPRGHRSSSPCCLRATCAFNSSSASSSSSMFSSPGDRRLLSQR